jgi:predicted Zn-dependent protease
VAKVSLVIVALFVVAWLGANLWSTDEAQEGAILVARAKRTGDRPADYERARSDFQRARRFAPDASVLVQEARVLLFVGYPPRRVARIAEDVVRREPDNTEAWVLLYTARTSSGERRAAALAKARALNLDPSLEHVL